MLLSIRSLADDQTILTGAQAGRRLFAQLVANAQAPSESEPAFLDFNGVTVATASFLRESVVAFRDYARSTLPTLYPVIANPTDVIVEELEFFLRHRKDAFWVCQLDARGRVIEARLIGELDEAHQIAFDLVIELGSASAPILAARSGLDDAVKTTAWNNRLAFLASRGLLIERRTGKIKNFSPVLETM